MQREHDAGVTMTHALGQHWRWDWEGRQLVHSWSRHWLKAAAALHILKGPATSYDQLQVMAK